MISVYGANLIVFRKASYRSTFMGKGESLTLLGLALCAQSVQGEPETISAQPTVTIEVGSPSQRVSATIDSGSNVFWINSVMCSACGKAPELNPAESASVLNEFAVGSISTGPGMVEGLVLSDRTA